MDSNESVTFDTQRRVSQGSGNRAGFFAQDKEWVHHPYRNNNKQPNKVSGIYI